MCRACSLGLQTRLHALDQLLSAIIVGRNIGRDCITRTAKVDVRPPAQRRLGGCRLAAVGAVHAIVVVARQWMMVGIMQIEVHVGHMHAAIEAGLRWVGRHGGRPMLFASLLVETRALRGPSIKVDLRRESPVGERRFRMAVASSIVGSAKNATSQRLVVLCGALCRCGRKRCA